MNFLDAKECSNVARRNYDEAADELREFPTLPNGMVEQTAKDSFEFKAAKLRYDRSVTILRQWNGYLSRFFKKELREFNNSEWARKYGKPKA